MHLLSLRGKSLSAFRMLLLLSNTYQIDINYIEIL